LVLLNGDAKHDGGSFLKVLPEVTVLALVQKVLEDIGIGGRSIDGSGGSFSQLVNLGESEVETSAELFVGLLDGFISALHVS
jgi:hypothetical protein